MFGRAKTSDVTNITIDGIDIQVTRKQVKNLSIYVHAPDGRVTLSAPKRMTLTAIKSFISAKENWIKTQQKKFTDAPKLKPKQYLSDEEHLLFGTPYPLKIITAPKHHHVVLINQQLVMTAPENASHDQKEALMAAFYHAQLRAKSEELIHDWEDILNVTCNHLYIQIMKTRWGSCNHRKRTIRLNLELVQKSTNCLNYVILHELIHFWVPNHGPQFHAHMDTYMPNWPTFKKQLNGMAID